MPESKWGSHGSDLCSGIPEHRNLGSRVTSPFSYSHWGEGKSKEKEWRQNELKGHGNNCSHQSFSVKQLAGGWVRGQQF